MNVKIKSTSNGPTPCRLVERLAGRAAGVGAIPETGPIECPCHRAFRQSHYLRFARLELGLGREDSVRYEDILKQVRWPRPQGCQLDQARVEEFRELLAFKLESQALHRHVPRRDREWLLREAKVELFKVWAAEDAQHGGNNRSSRATPSRAGEQ